MFTDYISLDFFLPEMEHLLSRLDNGDGPLARTVIYLNSNPRPARSSIDFAVTVLLKFPIQIRIH